MTDVDVRPVHPGQHRLESVQLVNWGTFSGYHQLPVSRRGFLLTGPSGSGKSSLLDAISVVLVPPRWLDLNAAARDASARGRDRTLLSYVRGAWSRNTDQASGELATQQLRPGTTWSAVGLTYDDAAGRRTTLVRIFWASSSTTSVDAITKLCVIVDGDLDLRDLEPVVADGLSMRAVKQELDPFFVSTDFAAYADKLTRRLGVQGERALRLLHKTQSTKGLSDLDALLRDFMLDEPATFGAARRTVEQFVELEEAYRSVQSAQAQVTHLTPVRTLHPAMLDATSRLVMLEAERDALDGYRATRAVEILRDEVARAQRVLDEARDAAARARTRAADADLEVDALREEHSSSGGSALDRWRAEIDTVQQEQVARQRRRGRLQAHLDELGEAFPSDAAEFRALLARAAAAAEDRDDAPEATTAADADRATAAGPEASELEQRRDAARDRLRQVQSDLHEAAGQLRALEQQRSNLDRRDVELRDGIAQALGVAPTRLPFVAELLQVREEDAQWRGVVERLLGSFARSLLVPDALYARAAEHINGTHLGRRLLYNRVPRVADAPRPVGATSIVHAVEVADGDAADWLRSELSRRFDYVRASTTAELREAERAVTVDGQVKHSRSRHEKDDRRRVDDAHGWVLGFDNHHKRALYEQEVARLTAVREDVLAGVTDLTRERDAAAERRRAWHAVAAVEWDDVDTDTPATRVHDLRRRIEEASSDAGDGNGLASIDARLSEARERARAAADLVAGTQAAALTAEATVQRLTGRLGVQRDEQAATASTGDATRARLDARFDAVDPDPSSSVLDEIAAKVSPQIAREAADAQRDRDEAARDLERLLTEFHRRWPAEAADVTPDAANAGEYLAILERLEYDGLPRFSGRFHELLDEQSTNNLAHLAQLLVQEQKQIRARIAPVNESLASVAFNRGTHLQLVVKDRPLPEVREFRTRVRTVLEQSLAATPEERIARFGELHALVTRLGSSDPADTAWRDLVLDVRRHVEFVGNEVDTDGTVVEVHTSGAGRSGGQRVKLVTFALAAALRYQLGGRYAESPVYGTVVIDEAFDKADAEFTEVSMRVFEEFGFQMVLATPLKMVQTLSEFIGGAALVSIRDRRWSALRHVEVDALGA